MKAPDKKPEVKFQITGEDGNAFVIIGRVSQALKQAGADQEYVKQFQTEAMSGDYDNVLQTAMKYADVS